MDPPPLPPFGSKMQDDARSSSSISSPPISPPQNHAIQDTTRPHFDFGEGVVNAASGAPAYTSNTTTHTTNSKTTAPTSSTTNGVAPEKPKRQRKKKETGPDGKPIVDDKPKEKKPRKPREPKDKTAGANGEKPATSRGKKQKVEPKVEPADLPAQPRQPTITEMVGAYQQAIPSPVKPTALPQPQRRAPGTIPYSSVPPSLQTSNTPTPRPFSSGQNYDPIRGSTKAYVPPPTSVPSNTIPSAQASPHVFRASASPAIASLIDQPTLTQTPAPQTMHSPQTKMQQPLFSSQQSSPAPQPTSAFAPPPLPSSPSATAQQPTMASLDGAMDVDAPSRCDASSAKKAPGSKSPSPAATPKTTKPTPPPAKVPKSAGTGMLSSSNLFGGPSNSGPAARPGVNIDLRIPLNPAGGNVVNIAQEITKKYGPDAVNPRAAAHRHMLMQMSAAQNHFSGHEDGDDMSVDLNSDAEGDSNIEMGGMEDGQSHTGVETGAEKPKPRKRKVEEYDKEDDFIDDTELAWQEQAAVAKDGFFVWTGPLVPEGEELQIESSAPARGRGRGKGSRGGRTTGTGTTHASLADTKAREAAPATRARPRAPRGTGTRKPRITKAEKERIEAEKAEREKTGVGMGSHVAATAATTMQPPATAANASAPPTHFQPPQQQQHQQPPFSPQPTGTTA